MVHIYQASKYHRARKKRERETNKANNERGGGRVKTKAISS
jgi:hypothetical protein